MGEPKRKVTWHASPSGKRVQWHDAPAAVPSFVTYEPPETETPGWVDPVVTNEGPVEAAMPAGPQPGDPTARETAVHEFGSGLGFELPDHIAARSQSVANYVRSKLGRGERVGDVPTGTLNEGTVSNADPDAPIKGTSDYLAEIRARRERGKELHPKVALASNLTGSVLGGSAVPGLKAAQGAGLLARGAVGAANVATDVALASGTAAAGAPEGRELEAAKGAAAPAAVLSTVLRAPGAVRAGVNASRRAALSTLPEDVRPGAEALTAVGKEGAEARAAALEGQRKLGPTTRRITSAITETEELADAVLEYGKVGLKRDPIVRHMAKDGVNAQQAVMRTGGEIERIAMELEELAARPTGSIEVSGRQAVEYARDAFTQTRDELIDALGRTGQEGGDAAADLFMRVDHLKRQLGRAIKRTGRGASPDAFVEDRLMDMYQGLRGLLEDQSVWGKGATTVQREVNAAWTPWLDQRKAYAEGFLTNTARKRGADGFSPLPQGDPKKIAGHLRNAGADDASNDLIEADLRQGLETTRDLTGTLTKHYDANPAMADKARRVGGAANEILSDFDRTRNALVKAREMRDFRQASPKTAAVTQAVGAAEDMLSRAPRPVRAAASATAAGASALAEPGRKLAALNLGKSSAEAQRAKAEAVARTQTPRGSDGAVSDPRWGQLLSSQPPGKKRDATYATLIHTDPDFRAREQARGEQQEETTQ